MREGDGSTIGPVRRQDVEFGAVRVITEAVGGVIIRQDDLAAVWLSAEPEGGPQVHLAYPLVTLGPEEHVFPCFILDDWGKERTGLEVYAWIEENGNHYPRAEIFAMGSAGDERQQFLREFDLLARFPVYALPSRKSPITEAVRIRAIVRTDDSVAEPTREKRPTDMTGPLARSRVSWWRAPSSYRGLDFLVSPTEAA
jgi:hypothetical protein